MYVHNESTPDVLDIVLIVCLVSTPSVSSFSSAVHHADISTTPCLKPSPSTSRTRWLPSGFDRTRTFLRCARRQIVRWHPFVLFPSLLAPSCMPLCNRDNCHLLFILPFNAVIVDDSLRVFLVTQTNRTSFVPRSAWR